MLHYPVYAIHPSSLDVPLVKPLWKDKLFFSHNIQELIMHIKPEEHILTRTQTNAMEKHASQPLLTLAAAAATAEERDKEELSSSPTAVTTHTTRSRTSATSIRPPLCPSERKKISSPPSPPPQSGRAQNKGVSFHPKRGRWPRACLSLAADTQQRGRLRGGHSPVLRSCSLLSLPACRTHTCPGQSASSAALSPWDGPVLP